MLAHNEFLVVCIPVPNIVIGKIGKIFDKKFKKIYGM